MAVVGPHGRGSIALRDGGAGSSKDEDSARGRSGAACAIRVANVFVACAS